MCLFRRLFLYLRESGNLAPEREGRLLGPAYDILSLFDVGERIDVEAML